MERQWWVDTCHNGRHDRKRLEGGSRHVRCRNDVCGVEGELRNLGSTSSNSQVIGMLLKEKERIVLVPGYVFLEET